MRDKTQKLDKLHKRIGEIEYALACKDSTLHEEDRLLEEREAIEIEIEGYYDRL